MGSRRIARGVALAIISAVAVATAPQSAAWADGVVTWTNASTGNRLEVYGQSTVDGAVVGTWPNNGRAHQYWVDTKLSDGYYTETNYNSGKNMDGYRDCSVHQYGTGTPDQRRWKELKDGAYWWLINKKGCNGNAYIDALSVNINQYGTELLWEQAGVCMGSFPYLCRWS